jgi:glycosyltransferase involved in cell wall biosynthesis
MLEVALDTSPLAQTRAGTARYLRGLLGALKHEPAVHVHQHAFGARPRLAVPVRDVGWYLGVLPLLARTADVLHCPTFRAPVRSGVPLVVTFHDLAVLRHPEAFNAWTRAYSRTLLPRVARAAARLIAVSEFTAQELIDVLGVPEKKISVIPNAVGEPFTAEGDAAEGEYVLAVGTLEPRKVDPVSADGVRWLGEVSDDDLARLYRGARCAAYVSLYEGFGLPVLEAMACGTAVVSSDLPAVREFAGGVVTVDPRDPDSIASGLTEALGRREQLGREGREAAAAFDWPRFARETVEVYREVAA